MFYYSNFSPVAGKPCKIVEKDKDGITRGEYIGYWDPKRGVIRLYPAKGSWMYGRLDKKVINERVLRVG